MAKRGSNKFESVEQENWLARLFNGKRSPSSGAAEHDAGDVKTDTLLIEAKVRMPERIAVTKPLPVYVRQLGKVAEEAAETDRTPMLAQRFYFPNEPRANRDGWVDVVVMYASDAAEREETFVKWNNAVEDGWI